MDLERKVKVGDKVMYVDSGEFVYSIYTSELSTVIEIKTIFNKLCVVYDDGGYDYCEKVKPIPTLLIELEED